MHSGSMSTPISDNSPQDSAANAARLLLTVPETAQVLGLGRTKIYELINDGELEAIHVGRAVRIPTEAISEFVQRKRAAATVS